MIALQGAGLLSTHSSVCAEIKWALLLSLFSFEWWGGEGVAIHNFVKYSQFTQSLVIATLSEWFAAEK